MTSKTKKVPYHLAKHLIAIHRMAAKGISLGEALEKPLYFDPFGQTGLLTLAIK